VTAPSVVAHVVTFNHADCIERCLAALRAQSGFAPGELGISLTDNASADDSFARGTSAAGAEAHCERLTENIGFCGAHNRGIRRFLDSGARWYALINPDLVLAPTALRALVDALAGDPSAASACPKLLRAGAELMPLPGTPILDAAGMCLTPALRHLDRGSGEADTGQFDTPEYVFGGSGACLLLRREAVLALLVEDTPHEAALFAIYPALAERREERAQLFDEAFFAYREDADLAWRAQNLGWRCRYVPGAIGWHRRRVVPERRAALPPELNAASVRNRFLLQLNNFAPTRSLRATLEGALLRNLLVIGGVLLRERSSLGALGEAIRLTPRALARRRQLAAPGRARGQGIGERRTPL